MREDLRNHYRILSALASCVAPSPASLQSDAGNDPNGTATGLTGLDIDVEHALEALRPGHGCVTLGWRLPLRCNRCAGVVAFAAGTPIDKTEQVFGDYIDKYTMRQSIEDGVTLEIVYEGRTHNAEVPDQGGMDAAFEDVFSEYNIQQRLDILGYGSRNAYLEAELTIEAKARDMVEHYLAHVFPNGYKAQVVATSREAAVRYKKHVDAALAAAVAKLEQADTGKLDLDRLRAMKTDVVISGRHNDLPHLKEYSDSSRHEASIKSFKLAFGSEEDGVNSDLGILIVNNMLLEMDPETWTVP